METTYSSLRENLATVWDKVIEDQEVVIVKRKGSEAVALVPAQELSSLLETAHLLRSPKNAQRLLTALRRARNGKAKPQTMDYLRRELKIEPGR
jgi:antitoxin YefM